MSSVYTLHNKQGLDQDLEKITWHNDTISSKSGLYQRMVSFRLTKPNQSKHPLSQQTSYNFTQN